MAGPGSAAILALTGGGILGRYSAAVLAAAQEFREEVAGQGNPHAPLCEAFDLIAGTSAGALIAAGLAIGSSPKEICALFDQHGPGIFPASLRGWMGTLRHLVAARYSPRPLAAAIDAALRGTNPRMGELTVAIAIPALNESTGEPIIFTNLDPRHAELRLRDVIMASAAAPTYFPAHRMGPEAHRHVDGGLFANAPDLVAVQLLQRRYPRLPREQIMLMSIGTTLNPAHSPSSGNIPGNWGLLEWIGRPPGRIVTMTLRAQVDYTTGLLPALGLGGMIRIDRHLAGEEDPRRYRIDNGDPVFIASLARAGLDDFATARAGNERLLQRILLRNRNLAAVSERDCATS